MRNKLLFFAFIAASTVIAQIGPPVGGGGGTIVGGGGGSVTSFSFVNTNGISGTVVNPTTTPSLSLALGAIMPTSVDRITLTTPATGATLTLADNTTTVINGGGTLALSNFTLTIPATGTAAVGAGNISATSTNNVSSNAHTHAVAASSNPGAATSILKSDINGYLQLNRIGLGTSPTTYPLEVAGNAFFNSGPSSPTSIFLRNATTNPTGIQSASDGVMSPQSGNAFRNLGYTSGLYGWNISETGNAEFNNANIRGELRASVFKINEITATAGTQGVFYSAATLRDNATTPATVGTSFFFNGKNDDFGAMMLGVGNIIRIKTYVNVGGVIIGDSWATVTARTNHTTYTTYTATLNNGSVNVTYPAGTAIVDYGPTGTGFITMSADGTIGSSPNMTMATHSGTPWNGFTTLLREGNLNGSYGYATNVYGIGFGQYGVAGGNWETFDTTNGIRIGNNATTLSQWFPNGNLQIGQAGAGNDNVFISGGALDLRNNTTPRIHLASDGSGYLANNNIAWDAAGYLTVNSGATIGGWVIGATSLTGSSGGSQVGLDSNPSNFAIYAGSATPSSAPFRLTHAGAVTATSGLIGGWSLGGSSLVSGSAGTTVGLDSGGTNPAIYAGSATPGAAPFRVTQAGALFASNANISGAVTATSGSFSGAVNASSGTFTGAVSVGSGSFTAGGGNTTLDSTGLHLATSGAAGPSATSGTSISWGTSGEVTTVGSLHSLKLSGRDAAPLGNGISSVDLEAQPASQGIVTGTAAHFTLINDSSIASAAYATLTSNAQTLAGLNLGSNAVPDAMLQVTGNAHATGEVRSDFGYRTRSGTGGATSGNWFNIFWNGTGAELWIDGSNQGVISTTSDGRYKHDVADQGSALERIAMLRPVTYRWKDKAPFADDHRDHEGFIAQELREVIPDAVAGDDSNILSVKTVPVVSVLAKGEQELMAKIDQLQAQIDELKSQCHN